MLTIPLMDGLAKHLSNRYSPLFLSWARYTVASLIVLPFAARIHGFQIFPRERQIRHLLRTLFLIAAMMLYFLSIARIPLAIALSWSTPEWNDLLFSVVSHSLSVTAFRLESASTLASTRANDATLGTQDEHFKDTDGVKFKEKIQNIRVSAQTTRHHRIVEDCRFQAVLLFLWTTNHKRSPALKTKYPVEKYH